MKLFKNTPKDLALVLILVFQFALWGWGWLYFEQSSLSIGLTYIFLQAFLMLTNYQCVAHNFIHLPFFESKKMNAFFSILNSVGIGMMQTLYYYHHLNHHRYSNDPIDPEFGTTKDYSSFYRYGKKGKPESILTYSLLGIIRTPMHVFIKQAIKQEKGNLILFESLLIAIFFIFMAITKTQFFLLGVLPIWLLGQIFAFAENYLEHHKATPLDSKRDSVSCYNSVYNFLWFNNGYHQEHHFRPQIHWSKISEVRQELPEDRRILKLAHWFNH